jgi:HK97 family phage portal protein
MTVPAMARCRDLLAGTIGQLPLELWDRNGLKMPTPPFLGQPDPDCPRSVTMAWTVDDLLFHGIAWWLVLARDPQTNLPAMARRLSPGVEVDDDGVKAMTVEYGQVQAADLIRFEAHHDGILNRGGRTLAAAVALENAATNYATSPMPSMALRSSDGTYLDDDEVDALLDKWEQKRRTRSTAFLQSAEVQTFGWNARDLQLVEARQYQALEIARLAGVPAWYVQAEQSASLTYQNVTQVRKDLIDFAMGPYLDAIAARLTMIDVTPPADRVVFGLTNFMAMDPAARAAYYTAAITGGWISVDEVRQLEGFAPDLHQPAAQPAPSTSPSTDLR